ncbi:MAG: sterol desaturase family protein [Erythrobacter sp.]|nr:sterol desaturase family protein [Erythrobacter sp.]
MNNAQENDWVGKPPLRSTRAPHRILVWLGAGFVLLAALLAGASLEWQQASMQLLSSGARQGFAEGSLSSLLEAGLSAIAWVILLCSPALIITGSWFALETVFAGWPSNLRWVGLAVAIEAVMVIVYFFANPFLQIVLPVGLFEPLVTLRSEAATGYMRFVFDIGLAVLAIIVRGFFGYWAHRASHQIPILWRFHRVHHSVERIDAVTDIVHPVDGLVGRAFSILMAALLGFDYQTFAIFTALYSVFGQMHHTRAPITLGPLGKVLVDGTFHRTHHSLDPKYFDRNYSASLVIYDKLFGSYVAPDGEPIETGLPDAKPPQSLWQFASASLPVKERESR